MSMLFLIKNPLSRSSCSNKNFCKFINLLHQINYLFTKSTKHFCDKNYKKREVYSCATQGFLPFLIQNTKLIWLSPLISKGSLFGTIFLFLLLFSNPALSWSGFDYENNATIDIGPGNLVRENTEITIFDWGTNNYHDVEILKMEDSFNGTKLEVMDLDLNKKRVFEMEYE